MSTENYVPIIALVDEGTPEAAIALPIAEEKIAKGSTLKLPLPISQMLALESLPDFIGQCGDTAKGHGFWYAHTEKALKTLGVPIQDYSDWLAASWADGPQVIDPDLPNDDPKVLAFEQARSRGAALTAQTALLCSAVFKLTEEELLGDPAIFLGLMGTEIAEATEAVRNGNWSEPSGVWEELSDTMIRLFDFIARYGQKHKMPAGLFVAMIRAKMAVNESRPPKHGKEY